MKTGRTSFRQVDCFFTNNECLLVVCGQIQKTRKCTNHQTNNQITPIVLWFVFVKAKHGIRLSSFVVLASSMAQKTKVIFGFTFPNLYFTSPYCTKKKCAVENSCMYTTTNNVFLHHKKLFHYLVTEDLKGC